MGGIHIEYLPITILRNSSGSICLGVNGIIDELFSRPGTRYHIAYLAIPVLVRDVLNLLHPILASTKWHLSRCISEAHSSTPDSSPLVQAQEAET